MKYAILSALAGAAQLAAAAPDYCRAAVFGSTWPQYSSHLGDCISYFDCTTTTRVAGTTQTVTQTVTPAAVKITQTTVLPGGTTLTSVSTLAPYLTTVRTTLPHATTTILETPAPVPTRLTITPDAVTVTVTVTPSPITTVTVSAGTSKRAVAATDLSCPTRIPAYASKLCNASRYSTACWSMGVRYELDTSTIGGGTTTVTVKTTLGGSTQTNVVTLPAPTVTVSMTAPATTSTVTLTRTGPVDWTTSTLPAGTSTRTTTIAAPTTTTTTTLPSPTATQTVGPASPLKLCSNDGIEWAYFSDATAVDSNDAQSAFDPTAHMHDTPVANSTTHSLGYANDGKVYGTTQAPHAFVIEHRGYLLITTAGVYNFTAYNATDLLYTWVGSQAYSGWTASNANMYLNAVPGASDPTNQGLYQFTATADDKLHYVPFRVVFKAGDASNAAFVYTVTDPRGNQVINGTAATPASPLVVRYSCDGGASAPAFPAWGSES